MILKNKKHNGTTNININDNIILSIQCYDLRKECPYNNCPVEYLYSGHYILYSVSIVVDNYKEKKRFKKGKMKIENANHVGNGNVSDLLKIKDILFDISNELSHHEMLLVSGWDRRRAIIYKHFLTKDIRFDNRMLYWDDGDIGICTKKSIKEYNINMEKCGKKKLANLNEKKWRELSEC